MTEARRGLRGRIRPFKGNSGEAPKRGKRIGQTDIAARMGEILGLSGGGIAQDTERTIDGARDGYCQGLSWRGNVE